MNPDTIRDYLYTQSPWDLGSDEDDAYRDATDAYINIIQILRAISKWKPYSNTNMETITKNYEVYTFDELDPKVQEKVLDRHRNNEWYPSWEWWDCDYEDFITKLNEQGWNTTADQIQFSGFYSQGDGASFEGNLSIQKWLDYHKLSEKYPLAYKAALQGAIWGRIQRNNYANHYCHSRTRYFEIDHECEDYLVADIGIAEEQLPAFKDEVAALEKDIESDREDLADELYKTLEKSYDYLMSDEVIKEEINNNDDRFLKDGSIFN